MWEQGPSGSRPGTYPPRRAWKLRVSVSMMRLRRRPHRLPLQRPSSTTAPTSALVAVSAGMTVSLLEPSSCQPTIIRVVVCSAELGTYFVIGNCDLPQTTGVCPQSSGGKRSSRRESTFSTAFMGKGLVLRSSGGSIGVSYMSALVSAAALVLR